MFVKGASKSKGRRKANPFAVHELNALFRWPIFTGAKSSTQVNSPGYVIIDDHRKWVPLVMLFTGARPSEVAQLTVDDIKEEDGYPYISILTEYDPDDPDDERDFIVSHKTENAARKIPIHPDLERLGFLKYVERMKARREERLFPEWKLSSDPRKLYSSDSWVRNFNDKIILGVIQGKPKPTLYSLRHTWKTQMAIHKVPPQYQNQLLGHAQQGMDEHYLGRLGIEHTYNAIKDIKFEGLDLSHLYQDSSANTKS
ncbi:site-specific integrase [Brevundimonas sp. LF-1]|uniref:site-specific integrase n=1 Tax=Brevundimonas sp. LF-1 TaxID=3126100 RepID=UPI0030E48FA2